jgi:hypothetical protein
MRGYILAAGGGFEPPLPDPKSGVLPLDDPATRMQCTRFPSYSCKPCPTPSTPFSTPREFRESGSHEPSPVSLRATGKPDFCGLSSEGNPQESRYTEAS